MVVICNIYRSVEDLLPHFFDHYSSLGICRFLFAVHNGMANPCWQRILALNTSNLHVELYPSYDGPINGESEGKSLDNLRLRVPINDWYLPADLDELHSLGEHSFTEVRDACELEGAHYVKARLVDRVTADGHVPLHIEVERPIARQFPRDLDITESVLRACVDKVCMARQWVRVNDGHHHPVNACKAFSGLAVTNHFKWFGDLQQKEREKLSAYRDKALSYYLENLRLLQHLDAHQGRLI